VQCVVRNEWIEANALEPVFSKNGLEGPEHLAECDRLGDPSDLEAPLAQPEFERAGAFQFADHGAVGSIEKPASLGGGRAVE